MRMSVYSVYDTKAEAFLQPFFAPTHGSALRSFADAAQDEKHQFHKHAADYNLFHIGYFDEEKGILSPLETGVVNMGNAIEYLQGDKS